jgi:hypothetical protein
MQTTRIEFRQSRGFGDKISATFQFLIINFRPIFRSTVLISGPIILIGIILGTFLRTRVTGNWPTFIVDGIKSQPLVFISLILIGMFYFMFVYTTILAIIYSYIQLYLEESESITDTQTVFEYTKANFRIIASTTFGLFMLFIVVYLVIALFMAIFAIFGNVAGSQSLLVFLGIFVVLPLVIYVTITMSFVPFIRIIEKIGFFASIKRSLFLIKGHWWATFIYIIVIIITQIIVSYIFQIPLLAYLHVFPLLSLENTSSPIYIGGYSFLYLFNLFAGQILNIFTLIAVAFQYFNLVETKEGVGLQQRITKIGVKKQDNEEDF